MACDGISTKAQMAPDMRNVSSKTEDYLREYAFIFFAQKRTIIWVSLVVFLISAAVAFFWPPIWGATGSIMVKGRTDKSITSLDDPRILLERTRKEDLFSEAAMLTSHDVILLAVKELNRSEPFLSRNLTPLQVQTHFTAEILPSSNVIELLLTWDNARDAEKILGVLMDTYLLFRSDIFNPPQRREIFDSRSRNYMRNIEDKQKGILDAIKSRRAPDPELEIKHNLEIKQGNTRKLQVFREQVTDKQYLINQIESELASDDIRFFSYIDIDTVTVLNSKLQELIIRRNAVLQKYKPNSETAMAISKEVMETAVLIRSEATSYQRMLKDEIAALKEKIVLLEGEIDRIDERNLVLKTLDLRLKNIERESQLFSLSYDTYSKRKEEADLINTAGPTASYISIIAEAHTLDDPVFPKKRVLLPLGLAAGLLLGFSIGFIREFMDHRFKRPEDVVRQLGLPVVLSIPDPEASDAVSHAHRPSGDREISDAEPITEDSEITEEADTISDKNKFSTLLGWTRKDDLPSLDGK